MMIRKFKDGSRCIVEDGPRLMKINDTIHIRLGKGLNFIDGIRLVDGTFIQNMQYESEASIPTPGELAEKLSSFGACIQFPRA